MLFALEKKPVLFCIFSEFLHIKFDRIPERYAIFIYMQALSTNYA